MKTVISLFLILCVSSAAAQEGSYSYYCCFQSSPITTAAYVDGTHFAGPFRANGTLHLMSSSVGRDNDPFFYSFSLSSDYYIYGYGTGVQCTDPHYEDLWIEPYEMMEQGPPWFNLGVDTLPFGADQIEWAVVKGMAMNYGLYLTSAEVPDGSRILLEDEQITVKTSETAAPAFYDLSGLIEPVVWIENDADDVFYLKGHPDSQGFSEQLTIGSNGSIYFAGPLEYNSSFPGLLGLISVYGDGCIADAYGNDWDPPYDIKTDESFVCSASILLPEGQLIAETYFEPVPQVSFTLHGGIQMQSEGYTSSASGGFLITYEYDTRLFSQSPPWYPQYELSGVEAEETAPRIELSASRNPFSSSVLLTVSEPCTITVYDSAGRAVDTCCVENEWAWNGSALPGGVYTLAAFGSNGSGTVLRLVKL